MRWLRPRSGIATVAVAVAVAMGAMCPLGTRRPVAVPVPVAAVLRVLRGIRSGGCGRSRVAVAVAVLCCLPLPLCSGSRLLLPDLVDGGTVLVVGEVIRDGRDTAPNAPQYRRQIDAPEFHG
jgi:hypothetical protein